MVPLNRVTSFALHDRTAPLFTTFAALIACILSIIGLISTAENGALIQNDMVMLNTSTLFQNAIKVYTNNGASTTARAVENARMPDPTSAPSLDDRQISIPGLPAPSQVSSFFNAAGSMISSAISPEATGTSGTTSGSFTSNLEAFFNELIGAVAGTAGDELVKIINDLAKDVTNALGIQGWYGLYLTEFCDGNYTSTGATRTLNCTSYNDVNIPAPKSTLSIGTTTLDFSALNIPAKLSKSTGQVKAIFNAIFAVQIIGIVSTGILLIITPLSLVLYFLNTYLIHTIIGLLVLASSSSFLLIACFVTSIQLIVSSVINDLANGLGIEAYSGGRLEAMAWVSAALMNVAMVLWFVRWHSHRYVRRGRELGGVQRPLVKTSDSRFDGRVREAKVLT